MPNREIRYSDFRRARFPRPPGGCHRNNDRFQDFAWPYGVSAGAVNGFFYRERFASVSFSAGYRP
jgi:hypothetical protein